MKKRAAAVLAACLLLASCGEGTPAPEPSAAQSPAIDYLIFGEPSEVGKGFLLGTSLDGSAAYVSDPDPAFPELGCEGFPESVVFRLPLDGGSRVLLGDGKTPVKGQPVRGPGGRIAFADLCEGFFQGLAVGTETPEGEVSDLKDVKLLLPEGSHPPAPLSFSWTPDGKSLLAAINDPMAPDGGPSRLIKIDPGTGAVTELFTGEGGSGVFQFAQLKGGTYVVSGNRAVTFRTAEGKISATFPANGFEVLPGSESIAVYGEGASTASEGGTEAEVVVTPRPDREISGVSSSPDGEAFAFNRYELQGSGVEVGLTQVDDGKTVAVVSGPGYGRTYFSGDGRRLVLNQFAPEDEGGGRVSVIELGE